MSPALAEVFADVAAGCWPVVWRVFLTCGGIVALAGAAWWAAERAWSRWRRHRAALAALMDDGDGQGGIPPLARKLARAEAPTEAISMRDLTVNPQLENACPDFCDDLSTVGDVKKCTCKRPCGRSWCGRIRTILPPAGWEREREWR